MIYGVLIMVVLVAMVIIIYRHAPCQKVKKEELEIIKNQGVIHFTSEVNAEKIKADKYLKGCLSTMGFPETLCGPLVWTYPNIDMENTEKYYKKVNSTSGVRNGQKECNVCLLLKGFEESELKKFKRRSGFGHDNAFGVGCFPSRRIN